MNQILQDAPTDTLPADTSPTATISADSAPAEPSPPDDAPPAPSHPRFTKPQRVAFVQSAWHRDVVAECRHARSEEHTSELQSLRHIVCRLLLEKKKAVAGSATGRNGSGRRTSRR